MKQLLLLLILLLSACSKELGNMPKQGDYTIKVTLDDKEKQQENFLNSIESVEIVPLELDSLLLSQHSQMRVTDDRIYIFTKQTHELYTFSKAGQYISKVSSLGNIPEYGVNASNITLLSDSTVAIYDTDKGTILFYSKDNKFLKSLNMRHTEANNMAFLNDSSFVLYNKKITLSKTSSEYPDSLREDAPVASTGNSHPNRGHKTRWKNTWDCNIYSFIADSVYCKYKIDFGRHSTPESFFVEYEKELSENKAMESVFSDNKYPFFIKHFHESENYVFIQFLIQQQIYYSIWDKRTEQCSTVMRRMLGEWAVFGDFSYNYQNHFYSLAKVSNINKIMEHKNKITDKRILSLINQLEEYKKTVYLEKDDYILLSFKMK